MSIVFIGLIILSQITKSTSYGTSPVKSMNAKKVVPSHIFIFGLGYTGLALVSSIKKRYPDCLISGTCRSLDKAESLMKFGIVPYIFDPDVSFDAVHAIAYNSL